MSTELGFNFQLAEFLLNQASTALSTSSKVYFSSLDGTSLYITKEGMEQ